MRIFIVVIMALFTFQVNAQEFNKVDANGKMHGKYKKYFKGDKHVRYTGQFNHGKPYGDFLYYKPIKDKDVLAVKRVFNNDNNIVKVTFYNEKGNIVSTGSMIDKTFVGQWLYFHNNSDVVMTKEFYNNNGKLEGDKKVFYKSGQLAEIMPYKNGLLEGANISYTKTGRESRYMTYRDNKFHGLFKTYDVKGNLLSVGNYQKDYKHGVWKYYKNGKLIEEKDLTRRSKNPKFKKKK